MAASRKARDKRWHLLRSAKRVGMSRDIFALVVKAEPKQCAICTAKATVNDHCHNSKAHRGRLCHNCNTSIGLMHDDPNRLRQAATYLEDFEERFLFCED